MLTDQHKHTDDTFSEPFSELLMSAYHCRNLTKRIVKMLLFLQFHIV